MIAIAFVIIGEAAPAAALTGRCGSAVVNGPRRLWHDISGNIFLARRLRFAIFLCIFNQLREFGCAGERC